MAAAKAGKLLGLCRMGTRRFSSPCGSEAASSAALGGGRDAAEEARD